MQVLISVIIPSYNRAPLLGETLDSVLAQTCQNWECIVVDDGSTDSTDHLMEFYCEKDKRIGFFRRPENKPKGANSCRNYGFELSQGEYILFLDSDDLLGKNCLLQRMSVFQKDLSVDYVFSNTSAIQGKIISEKPLNNTPKDETRRGYLTAFLSYNFPWWSVLSVLWKRDIIKKFQFDESLKRFQDVDFHIRILMFGNFNAIKIDEVDNFYRISKESREKKYRSFEDDVVSSLLSLIKKYSPEYKRNKDLRTAFKRFVYIISRDFIFIKSTAYKEYSKKLFVATMENHLLDIQDIMIFLLLNFYTRRSLNSNRRIKGYNKLRKFANKHYGVHSNSF